MGLKARATVWVIVIQLAAAVKNKKVTNSTAAGCCAGKAVCPRMGGKSLLYYKDAPGGKMFRQAENFTAGKRRCGLSGSQICKIERKSGKL